MTRDQIEARMGTLRDELEKANEELGKLRPRVQFLESMMMRVDGALTVLQELLETPDASHTMAASLADDRLPVASS